MVSFRRMFSVVPLWQKRLMVTIMIVGVIVIQNLPISEDFTNHDINEMTLYFGFFFPVLCGFYAWILSAYKNQA